MEEEDKFRFIYSGRIILGVQKSNVGELQDLNQILGKEFSLKGDNSWIQAEPEKFTICLEALKKARKKISQRIEIEEVKNETKFDQHQIFSDPNSVITQLEILKQNIRDRIEDIQNTQELPTSV